MRCPGRNKPPELAIRAPLATRILLAGRHAHFSSQPFSRQDLAPVLERYPRVVQAVTALPEVQFRYAGTVFNNRSDPVRFLQFCLRKAAHLFLYGMYGDGHFCPRNRAGTRHT